MTVKTRPSSYRTVEYGSYTFYTNPPLTASKQMWVGGDRIAYDDAPKRGGKWPWKYCSHDDYGSFSLGGLSTSLVKLNSTNEPLYDHTFYLVPESPQDLPDPASIPHSLVRDALKKNYDQIDLNTSDAVLLYSGVLQAVPLLGAVTKFNSIMRGVQRHVAKQLRQKPFTTVLKDLIQADFIDRFVISPTLADLRKFQDACDYTLRVIETARRRNAHSFALQSTSSTTVSSSESNGGYQGIQGSSAYYAYKREYRQIVTVKAFSLLEAKYDMTAVDPLKIWAQRVGLTRPLDSVWDLVPFSFVVDYFFRAGDFISHLSDEMSSIEGLKGDICSFRDLWLTESSSTSAVYYPGEMLSAPDVPRGCSLVSITHSDTPAYSKKSKFLRHRAENPYGLYLQLMSRPEDYLSVNLDLSQTKKRTLAELIIQAKL